MAVVTPVFLPITGGAETFHALGAAFTAGRARVTVFASQLCLPSANRLSRTVVAPVLVGDVALETRYLRSEWLLREKLLRPDILARELIHFRPQCVWTNHPSVSGVMAGFWARLLGARWVATYHADLAYDSPLRRGFMRLEAWALRSADVVTVHAGRYRERLVARGVSAERVRVLQPYTRRDLVPAASVGTTNPEEPGPDADHPYLFVGVLDTDHPYKSPETLLKAAALLQRLGRSIPVTFVGGGNRVRELEKLAVEWGVASSVRFTGHISVTELDRWYRKAWALVLPSGNDSEGYGLVILEALAHGCPVIASSKVPGADRFVAEGSAFTYPADSASALASLLEELWSNPARRQHAASRARQLDINQEMDQSLEQLAEWLVPPGFTAQASSPR